VQAGEEQQKELADGWTSYLSQDINGQKEMVKNLGHQGGPKRRRRPRKKKVD